MGGASLLTAQCPPRSVAWNRRKHLLRDVAVPDNLIRLSTKEKEQGTALTQSMMGYRGDAAAADRGGMALGCSSGGTRRVGQRSVSRLVLLATRESQDTEVLMAGGDRPGRFLASASRLSLRPESLHLKV
ncbi:uncharacterized protein LOC119114374 [Pollicipes pollicipes]|uniref:uncharacterized protein LOC119114374 n=1 Tax=Pollicipes pollicipes TaxID=41117 RepID=UPI001884AC39|nr:uncharacterized protein LOC119114374 [Pollicipes pollicipes]XP_037094464.1 uncharacterized protein LOC119114374 [Pollicipes pollicipes]